MFPDSQGRCHMPGSVLGLTPRDQTSGGGSTYGPKAGIFGWHHKKQVLSA